MILIKLTLFDFSGTGLRWFGWKNSLLVCNKALFLVFSIVIEYLAAAYVYLAWLLNPPEIWYLNLANIIVIYYTLPPHISSSVLYIDYRNKQA